MSHGPCAPWEPCLSQTLVQIHVSTREEQFFTEFPMKLTNSNTRPESRTRAANPLVLHLIPPVPFLSRCPWVYTIPSHTTRCASPLPYPQVLRVPTSPVPVPVPEPRGCHALPCPAKAKCSKPRDRLVQASLPSSTLSLQDAKLQMQYRTVRAAQAAAWVG